MQVPSNYVQLPFEKPFTSTADPSGAQFDFAFISVFDLWSNLPKH